MEIAKCQAGDSVGAAIVDGEFSAGGVEKGGTGENDVWNIADAFILGLGGHQVRGGTMGYLPGFFQIQEGGGEAVYKTVAAIQDAVIDQQPAFAGFDGDGTGA